MADSNSIAASWLPRERFLHLAATAYDVVLKQCLQPATALQTADETASDAGEFAESLAIELRELLYELQSGEERYLLEPAAYGIR